MHELEKIVLHANRGELTMPKVSRSKPDEKERERAIGSNPRTPFALMHSLTYNRHPAGVKGQLHDTCQSLIHVTRYIVL